jgi:glucose/arabinose dehydrogenase
MNRISAILACVVLGSACGVARAQAQPPRSQFRTTVLASGLSNPTQFAFLPDGRLYLLSKDGTITLFDPATKQSVPAGVVPASNVREDGLQSIVLDPAFASNRRMYLLFGTLTPSPSQVVARFTALASGALDIGSRKDLLSVPYTMGGSEEHNTGCLAFGPTGDLFIGLGDNTRNFTTGLGAGFAPRDPKRPDFDAQRSAANTNDLRGKILRIRPTAEGGYTVPEGNLFAAGTLKARPEIYAMGLRHPYRITVDQATGWLLWAEPGPNANADKADMGPRGYDEINLAKSPGNYGWPYCAGNQFCYNELDYATGATGPAYDPAHPINASSNNSGMRELPAARPALVWYPYNAAGTAFPVFESGSTNAAMMGPVYRYDAANPSLTKLPRYFDGHAFIFDFTRSLIHAVQLDGEGKAVAVKRVWDQAPSNPIANPIDAKLGPDGALYFLGWGDNGSYPTNAGHGNLVRLEYIGPPDAVVPAPIAARRAHWSLLAPGALWTPPAQGRAAAYDLSGREIWNWDAGNAASRPPRSGIPLRVRAW